jgi:uncharacterized membrane protein YhdT
MSTRAKEIITVLLVIAGCVIAYAIKLSGGGEYEFPTWLSIVVIVILALSLLLILVLTVTGRLVGRRLVFLYVGVAVALPLFMPLTQEIPVSPEVQMLYDSIEELNPGAKVLISFDYDPPSAPELQPMAVSFLRLCFERDLKVIIIGLWPQGPQQADLALEEVLADPEIKAKDLEYGVDYVNLGYQTGQEFVIQRMGTSFESMFSQDVRGTPYSEIPLVRNVRNFSNIDHVFNLSAGFPGTVEWIQVAVDRYGAELSAGNTAVQAPTIYAYLDAGQCVGLLGGMNGAAEFEALINEPAKATKYMLSQSSAHLIVIAFIIIGNVAYFKSGREKTLKSV